KLHRLRSQLLARHEVIEKTDAVGLLRLHGTRGEQELLGHRPADLVRQCPGAVDPAISGGEKTEFRILAADPHVERGREHRGAVLHLEQDVLVIHLASAYVSAGRALRCGVAFSNASATRNSVASSNGLPTSCTASGRPPSP